MRHSRRLCRNHFYMCVFRPRFLCPDLLFLHPTTPAPVSPVTAFSLTASTVSSAFTSATFAEVNTSIAAIAAAIIFRTCLPTALFLLFSIILFSFHTFPSFLPNTIFFPINRFTQPVLLVSTYVKIIRDISLPVNVYQSIHEISFADFGQRFLAIHLHIP